MWSALSSMREEESEESGIARRTFLEVGTAGSIAALFPGVAAADQEPDGETEEIEIEWLEGAEANKVAAKARGTTEYRHLMRKARRRGDKVRPNPDNMMVARVTDGDRVRELVSFEVDARNADTSYLTVGVNPQRETVPVAALEYSDRDADGVREKTTVFDATGDELTRRVIDIEEQLNRARSADSGDLTAQSEVVSAQSETTCTGCKAAVSLVCQIGCSAPLAFICGLLGITVIGGIGCLRFVGIVCGLIAIFGCSKGRICRHRRLRLCS